MIKNMNFETREIKVGEEPSTAYNFVCKWINVDPTKPIKSQHFSNPPCKFIISGNDDYSDIVNIILKSQHSNVEIIVDSKVRLDFVNNLMKLKKKNFDNLTVNKAYAPIYDTYFNIGPNLFFSSTKRDMASNRIKEETAITGPGKIMIKDFNQLFHSYKIKSSPLLEQPEEFEIAK